MNVAIVTTGDELLSGNVIDTNSAWLSDKCWRLGHRVVLHLSVGDIASEIIAAIKIAGLKADIIIVSGGLGATVDDITLESAAKLFRLKMVFHEDIWADIQKLFKKIDRPCTMNNKRQALIPDGGRALPNRLGTAPGVYIKHGGKDYFFLPGVPKELTRIFNDSIYPIFKKKAARLGYYEKVLRCFGPPEASLDELIKGIPLGDVRLSFRAAPPEIKIKLVARGKGDGIARKKVQKIASRLKVKLKDYIFGEDEETLEEVVGNLLNKKGYKLAIAESCTGGFIADKITNIPGASKYFERGYVTYSNRSKIDELGVPEKTIRQYGAVSMEVATAMARGVRRISGTEVGLAVTGVAGPTGGTREKPVGTVHIAISGPGGGVHNKSYCPRNRTSFKEVVAATALNMLRRYLLVPATEVSVSKGRFN